MKFPARPPFYYVSAVHKYQIDVNAYPLTSILQISHEALLHLVELSKLLLDSLATVDGSMAVDLSGSILEAFLKGF